MVLATAAASICNVTSYCYLCHGDVSVCSTSYAGTQIKSPFGSCGFSDQPGIRCSGAMHWLPVRRETCPSRVSVARDFSDSVPESSNYVHNERGYHPLEEMKVCKRARDTKLSPPEIARTTVEANNSALLVFPSEVHCERHAHVSWAEYQYVVDEYGDIFFEILEDENMLEDRGASNPVNVLIGMDIERYGNIMSSAAEHNFSDFRGSYDIPSDDDYFEDEDILVSDIPVDWGMPIENGSAVHPLYFAKCLVKAVNMECAKKMDHPSNGVCMMGFLRPAFMDEELYIRRLFNDESSDDGYTSDSKSGGVWKFRAWYDGNRAGLRLYKLEIVKMDLFSVYGNQSEIGLQDFQEAEPDVLVHMTPSIIKSFSEKDSRCNLALKALCKKKGLHVEGANLIGVDSLGIDVRVFSGVEVQTHRFAFKVRVLSRERERWDSDRASKRRGVLPALPPPGGSLVGTRLGVSALLSNSLTACALLRSQCHRLSSSAPLGASVPTSSSNGGSSLRISAVGDEKKKSLLSLLAYNSSTR